ncbi:hypothetical protein ACLB2K_067121 [Fragaria x ananassa]
MTLPNISLSLGRFDVAEFVGESGSSDDDSVASGHAGLASMVSGVGLWQRDGRLVCHDAGHVTSSYGGRVAVNQWRQIHSFGKSLQDDDGFVEEDWFGGCRDQLGDWDWVRRRRQVGSAGVSSLGAPSIWA